MENNRKLVFCGDIHGELETLVWNIIYRYSLTDSDVIILGDFGVGFGKSFETDYSKVEDRLKKNNIILYAVRGNHDDPKWFDGEHNFENLKFLKDYDLIEIQGKLILPVGGATSLDRKERIEVNSKYERFGSSKRVWWPDESILRVNPKSLPGKVDIVVSHQAPLTFEPVLLRTSDISDDIYEDILSERKYLDIVRSTCIPSQWFYGHHHKSFSGFQDSLSWRCLGIHELFEYNFNN